jgi:hypothetical protein
MCPAGRNGCDRGLLGEAVFARASDCISCPRPTLRTRICPAGLKAPKPPPCPASRRRSPHAPLRPWSRASFQLCPLGISRRSTATRCCDDVCAFIGTATASGTAGRSRASTPRKDATPSSTTMATRSSTSSARGKWRSWTTRLSIARWQRSSDGPCYTSSRFAGILAS